MNRFKGVDTLREAHHAYWQWDEKYNDTFFKLGLDLKELFKKRPGALIANSSNPHKFSGNIPEGPEYVYVVDNKIILVFFGIISTYPEISKGLWRLGGEEFAAELDKTLTPIEEPAPGDNLLVNFGRGGIVTSVTLFRPDENNAVPHFPGKNGWDSWYTPF